MSTRQRVNWIDQTFMGATAVLIHSLKKEESLMQLVKKSWWRLWVLFLIEQVQPIIICQTWLDPKLWFQIREINQAGICIQKLKFLGFLAVILNSKEKIPLLPLIIRQKKTKISQIYNFLLVDNLDLWFLQVLWKYKNKFLINIQI